MDILPLLINLLNKYSLCTHYVPGTLSGYRTHSYEHSLYSQGIYNLVGIYSNK